MSAENSPTSRLFAALSDNLLMIPCSAGGAGQTVDPAATGSHNYPDDGKIQ